MARQAACRRSGSRRAVDGAVDAAAPEQLAVGRVDHGVHPLGRDVALHGLEQRRHRVDYPPVGADEEAGTSFSSETVWAGAVWFLSSPQCENVTVPWMADEPPDLPALVTSLIGSGVPLEGR